MDWDYYRYFLAATQGTSIREAAASLGVSHSTLLRKLDRLEGKLATSLFERQGQGLVLTQAGHDALIGAKELEESVQGIARLVTGRDSQLRGVVRVSMPEFLAHEAVLFDLAAFVEQFPGIRLEVDLSYEFANLSRREADIAIRCTRNEPLDLVGRKVGQVNMAAYATPELLAHTDPWAAGSTAKLIAWGDPATWKPRHGLDHLEPLGFFPNIALQVDLAKQGIGVASLPTLVGDRITALERISQPIGMVDLWVLYHGDLRRMSRVKAVRDFLFDHLRQLAK